MLAQIICAKLAPRKLQDVQQLRKAGDAAEVGMFKLLYLFVRPGGMKRDMDGRGSDFQCRRNIALKTVAHHEQFFRLHFHFPAKTAVSLGLLIAHDTYHIKLALQPRTPQLILLIHQFSLGKDS